MPHLSPGDTVVKNPPATAGDAGLIPRSGRSPGEGNGNPLQCSCLGNPMDRGAWWATVRGVAKESHTTEHKHTMHSTDRWLVTFDYSPKNLYDPGLYFIYDDNQQSKK